MSFFRSVMLSVIIGLVPLAASAAPPLAPLPPLASPAPLAPLAQRSLPVINVQSTYCDYRGCFGFGPTQFHRRAYVQPNYRPPGATGPTYYQPRAQQRPQLSYETPPVSTLRPAAKDRNMHAEWCGNQYRSYNAKTDRYVTRQGISKTCNSPFD